MPMHEPISEAFILVEPEVAARTAQVYARIRSVIPTFKWPEFAPDIDAILRLKRERNAVIRDNAGLAAAVSQLEALAFAAPRPSMSADFALVGLLIATAAVERTESRGGHFRRDYPAPSTRQANSLSFSLADVQAHTAQF